MPRPTTRYIFFFFGMFARFFIRSLWKSTKMRILYHFGTLKLKGSRDRYTLIRSINYMSH